MKKIILRNIVKKITLIKVLEWVAVAINFLGAYLIIVKSPMGFIAYIVGNVLLTVVFLKNKLWGLLIQNVVWAIMNVCGYINWTK